MVVLFRFSLVGLLRAKAKGWIPDPFLGLGFKGESIGGDIRFVTTFVDKLYGKSSDLPVQEVMKSLQKFVILDDDVFTNNGVRQHKVFDGWPQLGAADAVLRFFIRIRSFGGFPFDEIIHTKDIVLELYVYAEGPVHPGDVCFEIEMLLQQWVDGWWVFLPLLGENYFMPRNPTLREVFDAYLVLDKRQATHFKSRAEVSYHLLDDFILGGMETSINRSGFFIRNTEDSRIVPANGFSGDADGIGWVSGTEGPVKSVEMSWRAFGLFDSLNYVFSKGVELGGGLSDPLL